MEVIRDAAGEYFIHAADAVSCNTACLPRHYLYTFNHVSVSQHLSV